MRIYTVGHSTHPIDEFIVILRAHAVERLVDIRTVPKSRRNPQFGAEHLAASLEGTGIDYRPLASLGGLRKTSKESPNGAWRNLPLRGYADHMQTADFATGIEELIALAADRPTAIMCAEAVPWRCHRSLVGDALLVRGIEVLDIMGPGAPKPHTLTSFAQVEGPRMLYPPDARAAQSE